MRSLARSSVAVVAAGILVLAPGTSGAAGVLLPPVGMQTAPDALSPYRPQTTATRSSSRVCARCGTW